MTDPKTGMADNGPGSNSSVQQEEGASNNEKLITLTERFLKLIENRPAIWDTRRQDNKDTNFVISRWKEISRAMNIRREILLRTWDTLRTHLDIACLMVHPELLNDEFEEELKIKYPFFGPMMFMKQVQPLWMSATINQQPKTPPPAPSTSAASDPAQSKADVNNNGEMVIHANEYVREIVIYISDGSGPVQEADNQAQAEDQNHAPVEAPNEAPAEAQNQAPSEAPNEAPAEAQNQAPAEGQNRDPGKAQNLAPKPAKKPAKKRKLYMEKDMCKKKMLKLEQKMNTLQNNIQEKMNTLQNNIQEKINTLQNNIQCQENEDVRFYKTFLPYISKIPSKKRLQFRKRIVEVMDEFAEQSESETEEETRPRSPVVVVHNEESSDSLM
ncbi:hypothetical protein LSTR_LSTR004178 [Laodelphax striatellus]|uniref:MADF domain-containing protein n=1 Tax=Laodelphax striatellus TaxID=195883 RepID=A0A482XA49_LAOST|nr:hypothetical protein LSTR_LSTR004178 [Laodelphax striatellus]